MRIQHNISAMNSYRNFSANNSKLSKNLEKLSTGYAINRAGDDAAGLAISEKMRAQITGLEGATKNAKDGISLIQTAEGALTEVHDMLNRMTTLAEQSANGTYDDSLDRQQLQKEVQSLKDEIDRIADSTNFNGLKLLDGSLSSTGKNGVSADLSKLGVDVLSSAKTISAQKGKFTTTSLVNTTQATSTVTAAADNKYTITLSFTDADGNEQTVTESLIMKTGNTTTKAATLVRDNGTDDGEALTSTTVATANGTITATELGNAFKEILGKNELVKANFTVDATDGQLSFESKMPGKDGATLNSYAFSFDSSRKTNNSADITNFTTKIANDPLANDAITVYDLSKAKVWKNTDGAITNQTDQGKATRDLEEAIFEVNGEKFVFVQNQLSDEDIKKLGDAGVTNWVVQDNTGRTPPTAGNMPAPTEAQVQDMAQKISQATGLIVETGTITANTTQTYLLNGETHTLGKDAWDPTDPGAASTGTYVRFIDSEGATAGGLQLQIGDTGDDFNTLKVSVGDMHSKMIGVGDVDISTQKGAGEALDKIKTAINNVSDTRGTLGALQNRLDHTINNLGVMRENIQNAESNIRDTDVAEEMMKYTKNNILNQSAQAMLAQANQLPQGVLQLLG